MTLEEFVQQEGGVTAAARALKISRQHMYQLLTRKHRPGRLLEDSLKTNKVTYP